MVLTGRRRRRVSFRLIAPMSNVLRLAVVDPNDDTRDTLKNTLLGMDMVWLEAECSRYEFFADVVAQTHPAVGIVAMDGNPEKALQLVSEISSNAPDCSILVVSSSTDGSLILQAMRAGAKEFLQQPVEIEDLLSALERIRDRSSSGEEGRCRGNTVIAVAGAIGGVGTTSLAVNLGCSLAADERNTVALVDLDMCLGDADVLLDSIPDYTLVDVAQNVSRLDFTLLKRSLMKHSSGLFLLPRPVNLEDVALITPDDWQRVLALLKATFSHLIMDLSKGYSPIDMVTLQEADHILMVTQLDLPCLRNVTRLMMSLGEMDGMADKVKIVVNRIGLENGQITLKKAQETIGREIFWQLPNDYKVMAESRNDGIPLIEQAPKANITHAISQLAAALSGNELVTTDDAGSSSLGRLFNFWSPRA